MNLSITKLKLNVMKRQVAGKLDAGEQRILIKAGKSGANVQSPAIVEWSRTYAPER